MTKEQNRILEINNLKRYFKGNRNSLSKAVDGITFDILKGETFGLVGESGCGKSTVGRTIVGLYQATEGEVLFKGDSVHSKKVKEEKRKLTRNLQMVFQDP